MIGKLVTALAGRTLARTVGGAAAGPAGAIIGATLPVLLPQIARRLGPIGMVAAAVGGYAFTRYLERRAARRAGEEPAAAPEAILGASAGPKTLEGEILAPVRPR
jgi:uncharacterized protein YqgC (DUF456 family)